MRRKLRSNAITSTSTTISNKSSFFKVLHIGHFEEKLPVPPAFIKHLNGKLPDKLILRSPTGRSWTIKMKKYGNKDFFFNKGWPEFVHAHSLQYNDFVIFKHKGNSKFHVKVYAETGCEKEFPCGLTEPILEVKQEEDEETDEETTDGNRYNEQRKSAVNVIHNAFKSKHPTCEVIIRPSHVRKWAAGPGMPAQFAKPFLTKQSQIVTLRISDGRTWDVRCTTSTFPNYQAHLLKGWYEFVLGNHLKEGDVCLFELVDKDNLELNVAILRVNSTS